MRIERALVRRKVKVTQRHIDYGVPCNAYSCPIAIAVRTIGIVSVASDRLVVSFDNYELLYSLPLAAQRFTDHYDLGAPVKPFAFTARLVDIRPYG